MNYNFVVFNCLVSLGILAFIWFFLFARLRRDNFRSEIRRVRDGLFDFMWQNGYDFDTPAYRETRQMLNGILRLSNKLTPVSFLISIVSVAMQETCSTGPRPSGTATTLDKVTDSRLKQELQKVQQEAIRKLLIFVYLQGLFGVFVRLLLLFLKLAQFTFKAKKWAFRETERFVRTIAYPVGSPNLSCKTFSRMSKY